MSNTKNLELELTPEVSNETFLTWRQKINGETDSNMTKIDEAIGKLKANSLKDLGEIGGYPIDDITLLSGWDCIDGVYKFEYEDALGVMGTGTVISSDANGAVSQLLVLSPESGTDCIFYRHFSEADISTGDFWTPLKTKTVNSLTSTSTQDALSAAMGKQLNDQKANEWIATTSGTSTAFTVTLDPAPTELYVGMTITIIPHTSSGSTSATLNVNGLGAKGFRMRGYRTVDLYTPYSSGFLAQNKPITLIYDGTYWVIVGYTKPLWADVQSKPSTFPPSSHKSSGTTYGVGDSGNYGHVKLSDSTTTTSGVSSGVAATPTAVKAAYDLANGKAPKSHASSQPTYGAASENSYGHVKLANNLTTTSTGLALDARQGKILNERGKITFSSFRSWVKLETSLSRDRDDMGAVSLGMYSFFMGGSSDDYTLGTTATGDIFNSSFLRYTAQLSGAKRELGASSNKKYAIFASGLLTDEGGNSARPTDTVDAFDNNLIRYTPSSLSVLRARVCGGSIGDYALFAGGRNYVSSTGDVFYDTIDAYNSSLTRTSTAKLSVNREGVRSANVNNYVLFAGGAQDANAHNCKNTVDVYNTSLVRTTTVTLLYARKNPVNASTKSYAMFASGSNSDISQDLSKSLEAFNKNLVRSTPTVFQYQKTSNGGIGMGEYAIFNGVNYNRYFEMVTDSLTHEVIYTASSYHSYKYPVPVGSMAVFAGGNTVTEGKKVIALSPDTTIFIPAYSKYKFQDHANEMLTISPTELLYSEPVTGYIQLGGTFSGSH